MVILAEFPRYVWTTDETFQAKVEVANYSNTSMDNALHWDITNQNETIINAGEFSGQEVENGGLTSLGDIEVNFSSINKAQKLMLHLSLEGTSYSNAYPIWVYPPADKKPEPEGIRVARKMTPEVTSQLEDGKKVLLFPSTEDVKDNSVPGLFPPNFWNYEMFKEISKNAGKPYSPGTLGILTDPEHPVFTSFPTDFHTNWQWFSIIKASNSLILDNTADDYRPIVQVIDNLQRNHKMGLISEFKVGEGKLLVCMSQLPEISNKPEAAQLYRSIIKYMKSGDFSPDYALSREELNRLFTKE